jgi:hypothetical protein
MKTRQLDNKTNHTKKGEKKSTRWKDPSPSKQRNRQRGQATRVHEQIKYSNLVVMKNIPNKEREGPHEITISS